VTGLMDIVPQRHWPSAAIVHPPLRRVARGSKVAFGEHSEPTRIARTTSSMLTDTAPAGHVLALNRREFVRIDFLFIAYLVPTINDISI
jgi:hypothetical protein